MKRQPRGLRNNNPGNIRKSPTRWRGEVEGEDDEFETFARPEDGIRAMVRILRTYGRKYGRVTVEDIIERWAPPTENSTEAYVSSVALSMNTTAWRRLDLDDPETMEALVLAIIKHENGTQPYSPEVIHRGVLAGMA